MVVSFGLTSFGSTFIEVSVDSKDPSEVTLHIDGDMQDFDADEFVEVMSRMVEEVKKLKENHRPVEP